MNPVTPAPLPSLTELRQKRVKQIYEALDRNIDLFNLLDGLVKEAPSDWNLDKQLPSATQQFQEYLMKLESQQFADGEHESGPQE